MMRRPQHSLTRTVAVITCVTLVGSVGTWLVLRGGRASNPTRESERPRQARTEMTTRPPGALSGGEAALALGDGIRALSSAADSESAKATLDQLRLRLAGLPAEAVSGAIQATLDAGTDAPTGLEFKLRAGGSLAQAPTLRLFLLDQLLQVDREAAARYAEKILESHDSPDEWALSLRNYAVTRTNREARPYLLQKFRELIHYEPWCREPTVGFLEAFDIPVSQGGTELLPDLAELLRQKDNSAVAHAAYLALDRLTINQPAAVLGELQRQPEAMQGRELTRANLFARADVSDSQQKTILEHYLANPALGRAELDAFAGLFPNANYMVSHNLLTRSVTPGRDSLVKRDQQSLVAVRQWLADPRFARIQPQLERIQARLVTFAQQAEAGARN